LEPGGWRKTEGNAITGAPLQTRGNAAFGGKIKRESGGRGEEENEPQKRGEKPLLVEKSKQLKSSRGKKKNGRGRYQQENCRLLFPGDSFRPGSQLGVSRHTGERKKRTRGGVSRG